MARHGENFPDEFMQLLIKAADLYEPAGAEEENAFNVVIILKLILGKMFLKKLYS
jgi:hypothetical protein